MYKPYSRWERSSEAARENTYVMPISGENIDESPADEAASTGYENFHDAARGCRRRWSFPMMEREATKK